MTNPRNRNRLAIAAHVTAPAKQQSIPAYTGADPELRKILQAVKENLDVLAGSPTQPFERSARIRDLEKLGLTGKNNAPQGAMPPNTIGLPVWTSAEKFELVTAAALANLLADQLGTGDGTVSLKDFKALKARVDALSGSITQAQLTQQLTQTEVRLRQRWLRDIEQALRGVNARELANLQAQINTLLQLITRAAAGMVVAIEEAAAVWTIAHGMTYPATVVLNDDDEKIEPDIEYPDADTVVITHSRAMTGRVIFR